MELQKIREAFPTARILVGSNGIVLAYPIVTDENMITSSFVSRFGEHSQFADMIEASKKFAISVSYFGGLKFIFSFDGEKIEVKEVLSPIKRLKTFDEIRRKNPPDNPNGFADAFNAAEGDQLDRFIAALEKIIADDDTNVINFDEFVRGKELHSLSIELNEKFRLWDVNLYDCQVEYLFDSHETDGVVLFGVCKDYFERMVRISDFTVDYGTYDDEKVTAVTLTFST